jgi:hypothetical protein
VQTIYAATGIIEENHPQWVIFSDGSETTITLPSVPVKAMRQKVQKAPVRIDAQRWEMVWLGFEQKHQFSAAQSRSVQLGYDLFETMTHAARNATDF